MSKPESQCLGKRRYLDFHVAIRRAAKLNKQGSSAVLVNAYKCPWCGFFHVGRGGEQRGCA